MRDLAGNTVASDPYGLDVQPQEAPTIAITPPLDGAVFTETASGSFDAVVTTTVGSPDDTTVEWTIDGDPKWSVVSSPTSVGDVSCIECAPDEPGTYTLVARVTDADGAFDEDRLEICRNGRPLPPTVSILPANPEAGSMVSAVIDVVGGNPECDDPFTGDELDHATAWLVNGFDNPEIANGTLADAGARKGDLLTLRVTPNDGLQNGDAGEASVTIANTAPSATNVHIEPTAPGASETLTCVWTFDDVDDVDTDQSTVAWSTGESGPNITAPEGETVTCTVTPSDGVDTGAAVSSPAVTVNQNPTVEVSLVAIPAPATAASTLHCDATVDDDGSPTLTYAWNVDPATTDSLAGAFVHGDEVTCTVTADDGFVAVSASSAPLVIGNTPPVATVVIAPASPRPGDTLTCSAVSATDLDGEPVTLTFEWTGPGGPLGTDPTLDLAAVAAASGDVFTCTAVPHDGTDAGAPAAAQVTVDNEAPTVSAVVITPATPTATDALACS